MPQAGCQHVVKVGTATGQMVLPSPGCAADGGYRLAVPGAGAGLRGGRVSTDRRVFDAVSTEEPSSARPADSQDPEAANILRSRAFWTLCAAQFLFFPSLVTVPLHIAVHGIDLGMTRTTAATLLTLIGGASIVGRLTVGTFVDRIGGRNADVLCLVPLLAGLLGLLVVETHWPLFAAVAVYGFALAGCSRSLHPPWPSLRHPRPMAQSSGDRVLRHHRRRRWTRPGEPDLRCHR